MDATSAYRNYANLYENLNGSVQGLRIGVPKEYFGEGIDAEVKDAVFAAIKLLEQNGAVIKNISLPSTEYAINTYYIIASAEASSNLARFDGVKYGFRAKNYDGLTDMYEKTRSEGFGDEVKRRIMLGTFVLSSGFYDAYYKKAKLVQRRIGQEFAAAFQDCDVILTPTAPSAAFKIDRRKYWRSAENVLQRCLHRYRKHCRSAGCQRSMRKVCVRSAARYAADRQQVCRTDNSERRIWL